MSTFTSCSSFTPTNTTKRRPKAFGRTSNFWQYVDAIHAKKMAGIQPKKPSRKSSLEEDLEDDAYLYGDERPVVASGLSSEEKRNESSKLAPVRSSSTTSTIAPSPVLKKKNSSKNLPDIMMNNDSPQKNNSGGGGSSSMNSIGKKTMDGSSSSGPSSVRKGGATGGASLGTGGQQNHSSLCGPTGSIDVIRRIQALGTSASAPTLPSTNNNSSSTSSTATGATSTTTTGIGVAAVNGSSGVTQGSNPVVGAGSGPTSTTTGPTGPTTTTTPLNDPDKLRNDFNAQQTRLYYGCSIALELFNGNLMMVSVPSGQVLVEPLDHLKTKPKDRAIFTLIDMQDTRSANTIRYGDSVWLQISVGTGESSWDQGGILGAKVREAPQLKALALFDDQLVRNEMEIPTSIGYPVPIKAYLPKTRDEMDTHVDEIQSRIRNKTSRVLGKWIIRSGTNDSKKKKDDFVYNNDEIYLEQDWFYLGADSEQNFAILRQLPSSSTTQSSSSSSGPALSTTGSSHVKEGEYLIERRAIWKIRLLDSSNGSQGLSLAQQQMERLLFKAKTQLKNSKKMRTGQLLKPYHLTNLIGTEGTQITNGPSGQHFFTMELRKKLQTHTLECNEMYAQQQEKRLTYIEKHMERKASTLLANEHDDQGLVHANELQEASSSSRNSLEGSSAGISKATIGQAASRKNTRRGNLGISSREITSRLDDQEACALCRSSSIGYNLCCQIHHVMSTLHEEQAAAKTMASRIGGGNKTTTTTTKTTTPVENTSPTSGQQQRKRSILATCSSSISLPPVLTSSSRNCSSSLSGVLDDPNLIAEQQQQMEERDRIMNLFVQQDTKLRDVILFKEKEARLFAQAEEQAKVGLSPGTLQFRERFKQLGMILHVSPADVLHPKHQNVGCRNSFRIEPNTHLYQQYLESLGNIQGFDPTGNGNSHDPMVPKLLLSGASSSGMLSEAEAKLLETKRSVQKNMEARTARRRHAKSASRKTREERAKTNGEDQEGQAQDGSSLSDSDGGGSHGSDTGSDEEDGDDEEDDYSVVFPTGRDMENIPPIDTMQALTLYSQQRLALIEMLRGFMEVMETHVIPNLKIAIASQNKASLLELFDFTARASEYICARRIQICIAKLVHQISHIGPGEFDTSLQFLLDKFLLEIENTMAFIRFYQHKGGVTGTHHSPSSRNYSK